MAPDLLEIISRAQPWARGSACANEPDLDLFFPERRNDSTYTPGSPRELVPLLICSRCPVRRPCLEEGLRPHPGFVLDIPREAYQPVHSSRESFGVWGGSTQAERIAVKHLPLDEAADLLERTFTERLERRITLYGELRRSKSRPARSRYERRADELLRLDEPEPPAAPVRRPAMPVNCRRDRSRIPAGRPIG